MTEEMLRKLEFAGRAVGDPCRSVRFRYVNYKGEESERRAIPVSLWLGKTDWHGWGWVFDAIDLDRDRLRSFSVEGIRLPEVRDAASE